MNMNLNPKIRHQQKSNHGLEGYSRGKRHNRLATDLTINQWMSRIYSKAKWFMTSFITRLVLKFIKNNTKRI